MLLASDSVSEAAFSGGIVAERIGGDASFMSGGALASATAAPLFVDEFSRTTNARLQTIALPATDPDGDDAQRAITENGSTNQIGFIARSVDGNYLTTAGYGVDVGTTGLPGTATTNNRIIARIAGNGTVDTSTGFSEATSLNTNSSASVRSTASVNGTTFYVGTGNTTAGTRYIDTFGAIDDPTDRVTGSTSQVRTIGIFGGRLFYTNSVTYALRSVKDTNTGGLPTTDAAITTLDVVPTASNTSPEQFVLLDLDPNLNFDGTGLDTLYMTQASTIVATTNPSSGTDLNSGGLQKYIFDGSNFVQQITFNSGLVNNTADKMHGGLQGLAFAGIDVSNNPIFYASTSAPATTGNALVRLVDSGASSAFTFIAQAPVNSVFRGVSLAPVAAGVTGDYNGNGGVDVGDYILWRKSPASYGGDPAGYNTWRQNFGNPPGSGSLRGAAAVPEPAGIALFGIALPVLILPRRSPSGRSLA
jgi:hypothetical protein